MSVQTIVLYGNRRYDAETYSTNQDPESLSMVLTDTADLGDTGFQFLAEAVALAEAIQTSGIKAIVDSSSISDAVLFTAIKLIADDLLVADASLVFTPIKGLSDFVLLKDWIEFRWQKAEVWSASPAYNFRPSHIHNYGPNVYYGADFYSSNPSVNWLLSVPATAAWGVSSIAVGEVPLYAQVGYGQRLYSNPSAPGWTKPVNAGQQGWTNANGESHN